MLIGKDYAINLKYISSIEIKRNSIFLDDIEIKIGYEIDIYKVIDIIEMIKNSYKQITEEEFLKLLHRVSDL